MGLTPLQNTGPFTSCLWLVSEERRQGREGSQFCNLLWSLLRAAHPNSDSPKNIRGNLKDNPYYSQVPGLKAKFKQFIYPNLPRKSYVSFPSTHKITRKLQTCFCPESKVQISQLQISNLIFYCLGYFFMSHITIVMSLNLFFFLCP